MSSLTTEPLPRSKSAPARTSDDRPKLSLGNRDSNLTDFQQFGPPAPPPKSVDNISTFICWSIFNLLFIPFGFACCYFSHKVSIYKMQNRYEAAKKWSKRTFVINIITTLVMFGLIITIVMLHYDYVQRHPQLQPNQTIPTTVRIIWQPGR